MARVNLSEYLPGVSQIALQMLVGPPGKRAVKQETFTMMDLPVFIRCPARCRDGGFDLVEDLYERVVSKNREEAQGIMRCRGYQDAGGRRKACNFALAYGVRVTYGETQRRNF
jgi:hypothetical protein